MGRHTDIFLSLSRTTGAGAGILVRRRRYRYWLPVFSFFVSLAIVLVTVIAPDSSANAAPVASAPVQTRVAQQFTHSHDQTQSVVRDGYRVTKKKPTAPAVRKPDPGTAKAIGYELVLARGWGEGQYSCLVALWNRESHWNVYAMNKSSGAYGIPQALPGKKMASAGADWETSPKTQIRWGLGYITARYGSPCGAWEHFQRRNWY